ncbi:hypothetical protein AAE478_006572 [Parahypoxylon ruwenzoriense]
MDLPTAPNGLSNPWNLGLHWGICSGPHCIIRDNLLKCGGCRAIVYCGTAHQKADRPRHKSSCNIVKDAREELAREEAALRAMPGDAFMPANPFETIRGRFWGFTPTRPYMRARFDLMSTLLNIRTGEAVEAALGHAVELVHLCRGDNLGVRSQVPALYLRLGRDQEAYDFIKWYSTTGSTSDYDWADTSLPFLDLHDEDVFEDFSGYVHDFFDLSFLVCITNLKIRLLLDLRVLERESKKPGNRNASYEKKMVWVREDATTDVMYKRRDIVERSDYKDLITDLERQVKKLVELVKKLNKHYFPALKTPDQYAAATPTAYTHGSPQEINLVFRHTWYTWSECPPAFDLVKKYAGI